MRSDTSGLKIGLVWIISIVVVCGCGSDSKVEELSVTETTEEITAEVDAEVAADEVVETKPERDLEISVYVCGAVHRPGVYELSQDSRIIDALEAAGGITEHAHPSYLNQAELLIDGQRVCVPTMQEVEGGAVEAIDIQAEGGNEETTGKVNINKASKEELMTLTGIGESKADSIIQHREEEGEFETIESIMEITGIKEGVYNKIKDEISVN